MIEGWTIWLLLVGLALGAAGAAVVLVRLPREEDDLGEMERRTEAAWIADTIERHGGIAPTSLVEEVLDLHRAYLVSPRARAPVGASVPPLPPLPTMTPMGPPPGTPAPGYGSGPGGTPPPGYPPPAGYPPPPDHDPARGRPGPPAPNG